MVKVTRICYDEADPNFYPVEDSDLVCQAGAQWMEINQTLQAKGM